MKRMGFLLLCLLLTLSLFGCGKTGDDAPAVTASPVMTDPPTGLWGEMFLLEKDLGDRKLEYDYDYHNGVPLEIREVNDEGIVLWRYVLTYEEEAGLTKMETYQADTLFEVTTFTKKYGALIARTESVDGDGSALIREFTYNNPAYGNLIRVEEYTEMPENVVTADPEIASIRYSYDSSCTHMLTRSVFLDNHLMVHTEYIYEGGDLVEEICCDGDGQVLETCTYSYAESATGDRVVTAVRGDITTVRTYRGGWLLVEETQWQKGQTEPVYRHVYTYKEELSASGKDKICNDLILNQFGLG